MDGTKRRARHMTDLFTPPTTTNEDTYREQLLADWENTQAMLRERGEFAPWTEISNLLDKDQYRLLKLLWDHQGYLDRGTAVVECEPSSGDLFSDMPSVRVVPRIVADAGYRATVNYQFTFNTCHDKGWLVREWNAQEGCPEIKLTILGRDMLDAYEADMYWEEDDAV